MADAMKTYSVTCGRGPNDEAWLVEVDELSNSS